MNLIQKILLESELDDESDFDLNSIFQPNPNQLERYKQELERRKKELEPFVKKIKLGLQKIDKTYENKQWKSEEEKLFLELFYNCKIKYNLERYPDLIFIKKDGKVISYQDLKNKVFVIDYYSIWKVFEDEFHWDYDRIQLFMINMLNEHFKLREYTPFPGGAFPSPWLNEHFIRNKN